MAGQQDSERRPGPTPRPTRHPEDERGAPPGEVPNEREAERSFPHTDARSLREAGSLVDADGDDIRQYSGEPVPTEHGEVIPQQMAVGSQRTVGGGEWPDAPPRGDEEEAAPSEDGARAAPDGR